jgi:hypothetical protein
MIEENMNISIQRDQTWSFVQKKKKRDQNLVICPKEKPRLGYYKTNMRTHRNKTKT